MAEANEQAAEQGRLRGNLHVTPASLSDQHYLRTLGERLRALRAMRNLSRRELSERSGLSQRFIAQLELGGGNISVLRLRQLLAALGSDLMSLHIEPAERSMTADDLANRVHRAPPEIRARIAELLDMADAENVGDKAGRLAFVGLRGAGKSTLGEAVAKQLGLTFVELNVEIERSNGMSVGEIFSLYGKSGYRRLERLQLTEIATRHDLILAVAGGIVDNSETYEFLRRNFTTVWLHASPDEHMARVIAQGDRRPMAGNPHAMEDLRRILEARHNAYARADLAFDTSGELAAESAAKLVEALANRWPPVRSPSPH